MDEPAGSEGPVADIGLASVLQDLATSISSATAQSIAAGVESKAARDEIAAEQLWRRWAVRIALTSVAGFLASAAAFALAVVIILNRQDRVLARVAVSPAACAAQAAHNTEALGCQNHDALVGIQATLAKLNNVTNPAAQAQQARFAQDLVVQIVTETDCRTRKAVADTVHAAFPTVIVNLPANPECAAYRAG